MRAPNSRDLATRWQGGWVAFLFVIVKVSVAQQQLSFPRITEVSAMCSPDGITAQIMFNGQFFGKIYSVNYAHVHDCVYYNVFDMNMVVFTVPNYKCGTKLTRNNQNVVDHIENEVYVQMDKDTQNAADRRYLFICELTDSFGNGNSITSGTLHPSQTVIVQTISPTRIVVTQTSRDQPDVSMEIQDGVGPFRPIVSRALSLGEIITLVVKGRQQQPSQQYNIFVHSCYAADGTGNNRVQLIDREGCTVRPQVAGQMQRTRQPSGDIFYFFRMSAFKFPGPDDVYFSCSVDVCGDCNFREICPSSGQTIGIGQPSARFLRSVSANSSSSNPSDKISNVQLHDYVKIMDGSEHSNQEAGAKVRPNALCLTRPTVGGLLGAFACLLVALIAMTVYVISITRRRLELKTSPLSSVRVKTKNIPPNITSAMANPKPRTQRSWQVLKEQWANSTAASTTSTANSASLRMPQGTISTCA